MTIDPIYKIGKNVYCVTNPDLFGIVTGIIIRSVKHNQYIYLVSWNGGAEMDHFDFELREDKDFINNPAD
jgi:hypothetical protein